MSENPENPTGLNDYDRVIASLIKHQVDFMIIGGIAVVYHGHVRDTKDMDIFIRPIPENAKRTVAALEEAGLGCPELTPEVFTADNGISIGEIPVKLDVLSKLPGVAFDEAWARRETSVYGGQTVNYIGLDDLIKNKRTVGRLTDLADVEKLEIAREEAAKTEGE